MSSTENIVFFGGTLAGMFTLSMMRAHGPKSVLARFDAWNWPSFGAGLAFAIALFWALGKIQP